MENQNMTTKTFSGKISAQTSTGETVTITVSKPDASKDTLTAATDAQGNYTTTKDYTVAGNYSAVASIPVDPTYTQATSPTVNFTIALITRTLTLNVT